VAIAHSWHLESRWPLARSYRLRLAAARTIRHPACKPTRGKCGLPLPARQCRCGLAGRFRTCG